MQFFKKIWAAIKKLFTKNDNSKKATVVKGGNKKVNKALKGSMIIDASSIETHDNSTTIAEQHIHYQNESNAQIHAKKVQITIEKWGEISTKDSALSMLEYLNKLEQFAVGIKKDIYDFDTLCEMASGNLISKYNRFKSYIEERRAIKRPTLYIEFEQLVERIKKATQGTQEQDFSKFVFELNLDGKLEKVSNETQENLVHWTAVLDSADKEIEVVVIDKNIEELQNAISDFDIVQRQYTYVKNNLEASLHKEANEKKAEAVKLFLTNKWMHGYLGIEKKPDYILEVVKGLLEYNPKAYDPNQHEFNQFDFYVRKGKKEFISQEYHFVVGMPKSFLEGKWQHDLDIVDFGPENIGKYAINPYYYFLAYKKDEITDPKELEYLTIIKNFNMGLH